MPFVIPTVFTAIDNLTRPVLRMEAAMVGLATIGGTQGAILQHSLERTSTAALQVATNAGMMGAALLIPLGLATKAAMDFEKQMTNVATLVDTSKESMDAMGDSVLQIASRMPVSISDLTESLYQIRSAGVSAAQAMNVLEVSTKLSIIGLSSATDATKAVTSAMVAFKSQGLSANEIANSFFLTVKEGKTTMDALNQSFGMNAGFIASAGIKLQDFNALTAALTVSGQESSEAQNGIAASVIGLIRPTKEMTEIYKKLGVASGSALLTKTQSVGEAIYDVVTAAKAANIEVPKLFNRMALKTVSNIVGGSMDAYRKNLKDQTAGLDAQAAAYQKQLGTTASQAQIAKNNLETFGIRIGQLLLPALTALLQKVMPVIKALSDFAHNHKILSGIIVGSIAGFGLFAVVVAGLSFVVYTVTKALWLWGLAVKALGFIEGVTAVATGGLTDAILLQAGAAKGAAFAISVMKAGWIGALGVISKLGITLLWIYGIWKLFDKRDEAKDKMNAILPHLPAGVDKDKFQKQFADVLDPGFISLVDRMKGVKSVYPKATYDTLVDKYYTIPKAHQDSVNAALPTMLQDMQDSLYEQQKPKVWDKEDTTDTRTSYVMPSDNQEDNKSAVTNNGVVTIQVSAAPGSKINKINSTGGVAVKTYPTGSIGKNKVINDMLNSMIS